MLELDFRAVKFVVLPSTGFEPTPLIHCSTIRLALRPAPYIYIHVYSIQYKYIGKCEFMLYASRAPFPFQSAKIKYRYICVPGP